ncbi:hypothetical protein MHU86_23092 [Fragilaria crotonensis]|nr:hypothetical protein MHU86_23092 [Fragilaria crotonensis]
MSLPYVPLPLASPNGNWFYFRFNDTLPSSFNLQSVVRERGTREVLLGQNVWRTSKIRRLVGVGEVPQRYFHILDYGPPSGVYELRFSSVGMVLHLTATNITQTSAVLSWTSAEPGMYFAVYQKSASEEPERYNLIETDVRGTSYLVSNLLPASTYSIQIRMASAPGGYISGGSELLLTTLDSFNRTLQPATLSPTKQPTTISPTMQPTTLSPTRQPTTLSPTMRPSTLSPTSQPTTRSPTGQPTTLSPTKQPTTLSPTRQPTTRSPTRQPTTLSPTSRPTTLSPTSQPTTLSPTSQPTTLSPTMQPTTARPTMTPTTLSPTSQPTTWSPTQQPTTLSPTGQPTSFSPTMQPTTLSPTGQPTTSSPTMQPTTGRPTMAPTTLSPTQQPTTLSPTQQPTTLSPTQQPTTLFPTVQPTTLSPTEQPTTLSPTMQPTTLSPTGQPTTLSPTMQPTTARPTMAPTTLSPTSQPTTRSPTGQPTTLSPTSRPTTLSPTSQPTTLSPTMQPTTARPTMTPTTLSPTSQPTTRSPTQQPTTLSPTMQPTTARPTMTPTTLSPTSQPTTRSPTQQPTTLSPTSQPTTRSPTQQPTTLSPTGQPTSLSPTMQPTTLSPTGQPTTLSPTMQPTTLSLTIAPTTRSPTQQPTSRSPTLQPTTRSPTLQPTTRSPTLQPTTRSPTLQPTTLYPTMQPTTRVPTQHPTTLPPTKKPTTRPPSPKEAYLIADKTTFYDGQNIEVTYEIRQTTTTAELPFVSWVALFSHDTFDYSVLQTWGYTATMYGTPTGSVNFKTSSLPALGKYKAVMAIAFTDPLRILGVSDAFDVLPNNATLVTDEVQYYEGELIDVDYNIVEWGMNIWFAWIGLFPHDAQDYTTPIALSSRPYIYENQGSMQFSSRNLPASNTKYKAVMAITDSNPLRILGISSTFDVLRNTATLVTEETKYYEGEMIDVTYTMSQDTDNMEWGFAWVAFFAHNVTDYSLPPAAFQSTGYWMRDSTATMQFSSRNLPALNAKYKAVMAITDSNPPRILGISSTFDVLRNTATLVTEETKYYEGETIDVTYTMSQDTDNMEWGFAWVALFADNVTDYSLPPAAFQSTGYWMRDSTATMQFSSRNLPALNAKYKAVMAITDSNPLSILGVSNTFDILQNVATLATDEMRYFEGETIDVTYTMNQDADNMEWGFAWVALFAHNVTDYSLPPAAIQSSGYWMRDSTATMQFSSRNLPVLNAKYKAVMAITDSNPLRIIGVSNTFDVLQNAAILMTDETKYYEGETIDITYTMSQDTDNMEWGFAWVALFAHNVSDYSLPPAAFQSLGYWMRDSTATMQFSSRNLPALNAKYKAVMAITDSNPLRIIGISGTFDVLRNTATLVTEETKYYEGETIDVTYTMSQDTDNMEWGFAWVAFFAHNVTDYSLPPAAFQSTGYWMRDSTATMQFSSRNLPALNAKYKAVMAITDSNPFRIIGISSTFDVLRNIAILVTDETQYYEGETIDVTYTMNQDADNMEWGFAWVALFADNVLDYSLPPVAIQSSGYWMRDNTATMQFSSGNLPAVNVNYKAVMAITDSNPPRVLGVSPTFLVKSGLRPATLAPTMNRRLE